VVTNTPAKLSLRFCAVIIAFCAVFVLSRVYPNGTVVDPDVKYITNPFARLGASQLISKLIPFHTATILVDSGLAISGVLRSFDTDHSPTVLSANCHLN
jgi:hypothetical protein